MCVQECRHRNKYQKTFGSIGKSSLCLPWCYDCHRVWQTQISPFKGSWRRVLWTQPQPRFDSYACSTCCLQVGELCSCVRCLFLHTRTAALRYLGAPQTFSVSETNLVSLNETQGYIRPSLVMTPSPTDIHQLPVMPAHWDWVDVACTHKGALIKHQVQVARGGRNIYSMNWTCEKRSQGIVASACTHNSSRGACVLACAGAA